MGWTQGMLNHIMNSNNSQWGDGTCLCCEYERRPRHMLNTVTAWFWNLFVSSCQISFCNKHMTPLPHPARVSIHVPVYRHTLYYLPYMPSIHTRQILRTIAVTQNCRHQLSISLYLFIKFPPVCNRCPHLVFKMFFNRNVYCLSTPNSSLFIKLGIRLLIQ